MSIELQRSNPIGFLLNQVELSNALRRYWADATHWIRALFVSMAPGLEGTDSIQKRLLQNADEFSELFGVFYGSAFEQRIKGNLEVFYQHLFDMAQALFHEDMELAAQLNADLYKDIDEVIRLLASVNSNIDRIAMQVALYEWMARTIEEAMLIYAGEHDKSVAQYERTLQQSLRVADDMAYAITRQIQL